MAIVLGLRGGDKNAIIGANLLCVSARRPRLRGANPDAGPPQSPAGSVKLGAPVAGPSSMFTLGDLTILMLLAAAGAWLWHAHGLRERALALVKQHCAKMDVELLDGNVHLRGLRLLRDARGRLRLARIYGFEFTVTGE